MSLAPQQQVDTGDQVLELLEGGITELLVGEQPLVLG
jgi:ethanolamine ammonia-lyase small subunit